VWVCDITYIRLFRVRFSGGDHVFTADPRLELSRCWIWPDLGALRKA
jgi:hypothetical protein